MAFIKENHIFLNQPFTTQDEVFHFLAKQAQQLKMATNPQEVYEKLLEREKEGTTGMMDGFAIPHAKAETIREANIIITRLEKGIAWESLDGQATTFIIALFIPEKEVGTTHLTLLSSTARLLMRSEITSQLKTATTAKEIAEILNNQLSGGAYADNQ